VKLAQFGLAMTASHLRSSKTRDKHNTLATGMSKLRHLEFDKMGTLYFPGRLLMSLGERISKLTVGPCYNRNLGWLPDKTKTTR